MPCRERPPCAVLVAALVVAMALSEAAISDVVTVVPNKGLPAEKGVLTLPSTTVCGCRVRCQAMRSCTAVTASKVPEADGGGYKCVLTNVPGVENTFEVLESTVSLVKLSGRGGSGSVNAEGTTTPIAVTPTISMPSPSYFVSSGRSNDGGHSETYCSQQEAVPASLNEVQSLVDLKTSDGMDNVTDINDNGIWVFVKTDVSGNKLFYNDQQITNSAPGITVDTSAVGDCLRFKTGNALTSAACADLTGSVPFACYKQP